MMHIELLVEEPSMEALLDGFMPRLVGRSVTYKVINFQNKQRMLKLLPQRLQGYRRRLLQGKLRLIVLIDEDRENCVVLKQKLENIANGCGLYTKTRPREDGLFHIVNRIVVEELEAWLFGDVAALRTAYPNLPEALGTRAAFRNPDAVRGGTWERLHAKLRRAGYYPGIFPKVEVARSVGMHLLPDRNCSSSFQAFRSGVEALIASNVAYGVEPVMPNLPLVQ